MSYAVSRPVTTPECQKEPQVAPNEVSSARTPLGTATTTSEIGVTRHRRHRLQAGRGAGCPAVHRSGGVAASCFSVARWLASCIGRRASADRHLATLRPKPVLLPDLQRRRISTFFPNLSHWCQRERAWGRLSGSSFAA